MLATLQDIFDKISNEELANVNKNDRYFFSQSVAAIRPTINTGYETWSGVTVVDLDVKNEAAAIAVKNELFDILHKQSWLAAVVLSTSHTGVHIYTCCDPRPGVSQDAYLDHLEAVSISIWNALMLAYQRAASTNKYDASILVDMHPVQNVSSRREDHRGILSESNMFDLATFRLTQPTIIGYDSNLLVNEDFELAPPLGLSDSAYEHCIEPDFIKSLFDKKRGRMASQTLSSVEILAAGLPQIELCTPRNYNNTARYRLAYTLANMYDVTSKQHPNYNLLLECFLRMCSGNPKFEQEKRAFAAVFDSAVVRQSQGMSPLIPWAVNELKTVHHIEIDTGQPVEQLLTELDVDAELQKPVYVPLELQIQYDRIFDLDYNQYVSDGEYDIMQKLQKPGSKTLLIAEPGTGKTVFVTTMMRKHPDMRILCVVPYISVIESKFKTLDQHANCQCIYGNISYDTTGPKNAVMTFDKFSRQLPDELDANFDLICLDESHLLQMSLYRGLVPANAIDNLRAVRTPCIVMTGTPIAEHMFIDFTDKVLFRRNRATTKLFNLVICDNPANKFTQACIHIASAVKAGRRVIVPTNEGNAYVEKISAAVETILGRPINYAYYKKENADQAFMFEVNRNGTVKDIELLFCSAYLSVGVDINDMSAFDVVYTEPFTAHEIEQFNNRLRRVDLVSYYFVAKYMADGKQIQKSLLANATVNLRMSRIRELALKDLLALNTVKSAGNAEIATLFDFITRHMQYPYLIRQGNGDVKLHATCYALFTFEQSWRDWAVHIPILMQQLKQYNYQTDVIHAELLDSSQQEAILEAARCGFALYRDVMHDDIQYIADLIHNVDFYNVLVYSNSVRLVRDQKLSLEFANYDSYNPQATKILVHVKNVQQCYRFIKVIRLLSKYYVRQTILDLYDEANGQTSKIEHVYHAVELLDYASNDRLSTANATAVAYILNDMFGGYKQAAISKIQMGVHRARIANIYKEAYDLSSTDVLDRVDALAGSMISRLAEQVTHRRGPSTPNEWVLRQIPEFDSSIMQHLDAHKQLMLSMFKASIFAINSEVQLHRETSVFFRPAVKHTQDRVDVMQSLANLHDNMPCYASAHLQPAMLQMLLDQVMQERPGVDKQTAINFIESIDFSNENNLVLALHRAIERWQP